MPAAAPSSSGLGLRPFTPATRVRVPLGSLFRIVLQRAARRALTRPVGLIFSLVPCLIGLLG